MDILIKDICKTKKDILHLTNQDVAEKADLPVSTVNNYFSNASKAPSVYTVGPICAVLGVSIDKFFGIEQTETPEEAAEKLARIAELEQKCLDYEKDLEHQQAILKIKDEAIRSAEDRIKRWRPLIYCLLGVTTLIVLAFIAYLLHYDLTNPDYGLFAR